jgi:GTP-binding protein
MPGVRDDAPEVVFAGRSNVGKSTLINALIGRRLAHVSEHAGKTRSVNFYMVKIGAGAGAVKTVFRLVDLPGYGYAERSKAERRAWADLTKAYFESRATATTAPLICHLVDFRHGLLANDRLLQEHLKGFGLPIMVVFTKADKVSRGARAGMLAKYAADGFTSVDAPLAVSGVLRGGAEELREFIERTVAPFPSSA